MRERVDLKSPVREYRPPGSVRGAPGNRCPYLDGREIRVFHIFASIFLPNPKKVWQKYGGKNIRQDLPHVFISSVCIRTTMHKVYAACANYFMRTHKRVPSIQRFNDSTIQRFNDLTIQRFNDSTI